MFLLIDKPKGITSHDVIDSLRKITGERRIGHAGTLDPLASGLLIIGVGRQSTKKLGSLTKETSKTYVAEIFLGEETSTLDSEGEIIKKDETKKIPTDDEINKILNSFLGESSQIPPIYSAIKISGKKAYDLARKGKDVELKPRPIVIHSIKLIDYSFPLLKIECSVSSGTYIRSLARDIGEKLQTFGYLSNLRRIKIDEFSIEKSVTLDSLTSSNWKSYTIEI